MVKTIFIKTFTIQIGLTRKAEIEVKHSSQVISDKSLKVKCQGNMID